MKNNIIKDYIKLQNIIGNILDCPGKGGNISIKNNLSIIIKSSGTDLKKEVCASVVVDNKVIGTYINCQLTNICLKPSMEIGFHKIIPYKYVVHYHPVYILPWLCCKNKINLKPLIDALPGKQLMNKIKKYKNKKIIYLKHHGIILASNSIKEIQANYNKLKKKYFMKNDNTYTPDDIVDKNSEELWIHRNCIENIAKVNKLKLENYNKYELLNDIDEKYRMNIDLKKKEEYK